MTETVLAVMAHPDDSEFFCGGTLALWAERGRAVYVLVLTDGGKGSDDPHMTSRRLVAIRRDEQMAAAAISGYRDVAFLEYEDGDLVPDLQVRRDIVHHIRRIRPEVVICSDPTARLTRGGSINHPDHLAAGQAALDVLKAAAGNRLYYPEMTEQGLSPHKVREVLLAVPLQPNLEIDITSVLDKKIAALRAHSSQIPDPDGLERRIREVDVEQLPDGSHRWVERFHRIVLNKPPARTPGTGT